jgi:hypothetical protein
LGSADEIDVRGFASRFFGYRKLKNTGILCVFQVFQPKTDGKYAVKPSAAIFSAFP